MAEDQQNSDQIAVTTQQGEVVASGPALLVQEERTYSDSQGHVIREHYPLTLMRALSNEVVRDETRPVTYWGEEMLNLPLDFLNMPGAVPMKHTFQITASNIIEAFLEFTTAAKASRQVEIPKQKHLMRQQMIARNASQQALAKATHEPPPIIDPSQSKRRR